VSYLLSPESVSGTLTLKLRLLQCGPEERTTRPLSDAFSMGPTRWIQDLCRLRAWEKGKQYGRKDTDRRWGYSVHRITPLDGVVLALLDVGSLMLLHTVEAAVGSMLEDGSQTQRALRRRATKDLDS